MKYFISIIRFFVGLTFIASGFVKMIDPIGFSYKMEEYFSPEVLNLPFLLPFTLFLSITIVIFEIILGWLLLLGFQKKFTLGSLLLITIFFGFLTFYSAYYNKVTDCGCFGDAIKFTPWQSFFKDIILLAFVLFLILKHRYIDLLFTKIINISLVTICLASCIFFIHYTLNHLPVIDFRPYKIGVNIKKDMQIPDDAPKPVVEYRWKFLVNGEEKVIITHGNYPEVQGDFLSVDTQIISKGYTPSIVNFSIEKADENLTLSMLDQERLLVVVSYDLSKASGFDSIKKLTDSALKQGYKVIGLTASVSKSEQIIEQYGFNFDFYFTDQTTLKTIIRGNFGILVLKKGTIEQKANYTDFDKIQL